MRHFDRCSRVTSESRSSPIDRRSDFKLPSTALADGLSMNFSRSRATSPTRRAATRPPPQHAQNPPLLPLRSLAPITLQARNTVPEPPLIAASPLLGSGHWA